MKSISPSPPKQSFSFAPWNWIPFLLGAAALGLGVASSAFPALSFASAPAAGLFALVLIYFLTQCVHRLIRKSWRSAIFSFLRLVGLIVIAVPALGFMVMLSFFGPSEDHFADNLTIPEGIDISEPLSDPSGSFAEITGAKTDDFQDKVRASVLTVGGNDPQFTPSIPSLRKAATNEAALFREYIEASPDWHVFIERGNHFASRRWSYGGQPRETLHGYISNFNGSKGFQTRCLLCLDRKQWSRYSVQHVEEGSSPVTPEMTVGNSLQESRVMIECGGVWVEIFEQSGTLERRVTKASIEALNAEFDQFMSDPPKALAEAKERSRELAQQLASTDGKPFHLLEGMQPGIYGVNYSLNPGEAGSVYLKAFEVTLGTALSPDDLKHSSETRMTWSSDPKERFGAKSGFTIYEGDWGKPYAARFEVWFKPDSGGPERKLAERIFKIEGWQR